MNKLVEGNVHQFSVQALAVAFTVAYTYTNTVTYLIL